MSVSASIDINLVQYQQRVSLLKVIQYLLEYGWSLDYDGKISFLPIGDDDKFNWQSESMSIESFFHILMKKEKNNEIIGVAMTWSNTGIGGDFLLSKDGKLSVNLSINRKLIESDSSMKITDINWYLVKLLPIFNHKDIQVESFTYEEHN